MGKIARKKVELMKECCPNNIIIIIIIIILSCLTSLDSSKPIQKRISVNHKGLSTPITT